MPKRQIRGKAGKQLYLNKIFNRGMLYTSSEMQEGFVKALSNYDITPTGDAATPRIPYSIIDNQNNLGKYTYPVKFKQALNSQSYIEFVNTVSKDEFLSGNVDPNTEISNESIKIFSRNVSALDRLDYYASGDDNGNFIQPPSIDLTQFSDVTNYATVPVVTKPNGVLSISGINRDAITATKVITDSSWVRYKVGIDYTKAFISNITVIDGDTIHFLIDAIGSTEPANTVKLRPLAINAPEVTEEWGLFAKHCLEKILEGATEIMFLQDNPETDKDIYGRSLRWVAVSYGNGAPYLLNQLLVLCGLALLDYSGNYKYIDRIASAQSYAKEQEYFLWNKDIADPYFDYKFLNVKMFDKSILGLQSSDEITIQALTLNEEKRITHNLSNKIDKVELIYLDHLDALGFLGRIVINRDTVVYSGLILIKAIYHNENSYGVEIVIPENNGQGHIPSITEAVSTGYNLYNKNPISTENTKDEAIVDVLGIVAVEPGEESVHNQILQTVVGSSIRLRGIINEGYYVNPSKIPFLDEVDYRLAVTVKHYVRVDYMFDDLVEYGNEELELLKVDESILTHNRNSLMGTVLPNDDSELLKIVNESDAAKNWRATNASAYVRIIPNSYRVRIDYVFNIYKPVVRESMTGTFELDPYTQGNIGYSDIVNIEDLLAFGVQSTIKNYGSSSKYLEIRSINNLNDINKYIVNGVLSERPIEHKLPSRKFISKWEVSVAGREYELISEEEVYTLDEQSKVVPINPTDKFYNSVIYNVQAAGTHMFKYSLIPVLHNNGEIKVTNQFEVITSVYPAMKVGGDYKTLTTKDLTKNLDIRRATRLGVYNRQIFLYGESIGSNVIQFSMFEKEFYFPFPYFNISIDEKIIHVHPHKDSLVIFGQYNIYMLSGGVSALELMLFKIYENLSIQECDIETVKSIGNNVMFFNRQIGYVIVPNKYTNRPEDIGIFKLSENISNLLINPETYIRQRLVLKDTVYKFEHITGKFITFIEDNVINLVTSYEVLLTNKITGLTEEKAFVVFFRYNQTFKYWSLYDTKIFDEIVSTYICEPQLGVQFLVRKNDNTYLATIIDQKLPSKFTGSRFDIGIDNLYDIDTFIDSGYLSVDTMNDKRFKDLLLEFNNIGGASLELFCNFFIDGEPIMISEDDTVKVEDGMAKIETQLIPNTNFEVLDGFTLDESYLTSADRVRVRFPLFGKGRMPSFTLAIKASDNYELLNFSIIYKEKNIERR